MENGRSVKLPVAIAAGRVDDCVLKYPPKGQPNAHLLRYWQLVRPLCGTVMLATRPMIILRRSLYCAFMRAATSFSTQFISIAGKNSLSGSCGNPSFDPLIPANFST